MLQRTKENGRTADEFVGYIALEYLDKEKILQSGCRACSQSQSLGLFNFSNPEGARRYMIMDEACLNH